MAWCCGCGLVVPNDKDTPGWYVFRPIVYRVGFGDFYNADKKYLCPDCAGSVRAWLGLD